MRIKKALLLILISLMAWSLFACSGGGAAGGQNQQDSQSGGSGEEGGSEAEESGAKEEAWTYDGSETVPAKEKIENITISADAKGNPKKISSSVTLVVPNDEGSEGKPIVDSTLLTEIKNRQGAEEFDQRDGIIYWQNLGENIEYEGKGAVQETANGSGLQPGQIPVTVKLTYYLNDEEIEPSKLAGKSGKVKIRIDYINNTFATTSQDGAEYSVGVPFAAITGLIFPEGVLKNIKVENGDVTITNSQDMVIGTAFPGLRNSLNLGANEWSDDIDLPEFVEIEGDAENFEMDFSTTIITNGLFEDIEDSSDIDELMDAAADLRSATNSLIDGASSLASGQQQLADGIGQYLDGVAALETGAGALADGISTLDSQKSTLVDGASGLSTGLYELENYIGQLGGAVPPSLTEEEQQQYLATLQGLQGQLDALAQASAQLATGMDAYANGVSQLSQGASQLKTGLGQLTAQNQTVKEGLATLQNGTNSLKSGLVTYRDEAISEITSFIEGDVADLNRRVKAIRAADRGYNTYSGATEGTESKVMYIIETEEIA